MSIKAVVFDFGNVICFPPAPSYREKMAALTGLPLHTLDDLDRQYRGDLFDRGTLDAKGYYQFILEKAGVFPGDAVLQELAQRDVDGWKNMNGATEALMREIQKEGFKLGILSNMPRDFLAWGKDHIEAFRKADVGIFSCELGSVKPETPIYEALLAALGCRAEEVVFFDDVQDNIDKAAALGIHGFIWKDPETARQDFRSVAYGIA
ncbi:phosphatase [Spirochaetia bacterium]|nr:phosphatase [Spirochaetia bacterium]